MSKIRVIGKKQGTSKSFLNLKIKDMSYKKIIETKVYKLAFGLAMKIFELSKRFPNEEKYSLTDQVRRSSRSVCSCLAEAHRKRLYPAHFVSKVSDSDMENAETQTWLEFALACKYIIQNEHDELINLSEEVGRLLSHMIHNPERYK
jgi:four helix bundle protein